MPRHSPSIPKVTPFPDRLPNAAGRLLAALAEPGIAAIVDPTRQGFVILRGCRGGISIGRGSHKQESLDDLVRRDLAAPAPEGATITEAGRAHLARAEGRRGGAPDGAFAQQHRTVERITVAMPLGDDSVAVNARESPLAWLRRRRGSDGAPLIDAASFEAGERLRRDVTTAGLLPSVTARWDGAVGGGAQASRDPTAAADAVIAARQRARAALSAVGGDFADLLLDLCCFLKGVEAIERERRWPPRSAKIVIRLALGHLARHYGLSSEATGRSGSPGIRTWFADSDAA